MTDSAQFLHAVFQGAKDSENVVWGMSILEGAWASLPCLYRHLAASEGCYKVTEWLIELGSDVNALDRFKRTPLEVCDPPRWFLCCAGDKSQALPDWQPTRRDFNCSAPACAHWAMLLSLHALVVN